MCSSDPAQWVPTAQASPSTSLPHHILPDPLLSPPSPWEVGPQSKASPMPRCEGAVAKAMFQAAIPSPNFCQPCGQVLFLSTGVCAVCVSARMCAAIKFVHFLNSV